METEFYEYTVSCHPPKTYIWGSSYKQNKFPFQSSTLPQTHTHTHTQKCIHNFQGTFSYPEYVLKSVQIHMHPCTAMYVACLGMFKFETGVLNEVYIYL